MFHFHNAICGVFKYLFGGGDGIEQAKLAPLRERTHGSRQQVVARGFKPIHTLKIQKRPFGSFSYFGGGDGVRTHGTHCCIHTLSKRAPSTTRPPLQTYLL